MAREAAKAMIGCPGLSPAHPYRGWYSPSGSEIAGSMWYRRADGPEVEVTMVYCPVHGNGLFLWTDRVDVGEVVEYLRSDSRAMAILAAALNRAVAMRDAGAGRRWGRQA